MFPIALFIYTCNNYIVRVSNNTRVTSTLHSLIVPFLEYPEPCKSLDDVIAAFTLEHELNRFIRRFETLDYDLVESYKQHEFHKRSIEMAGAVNQSLKLNVLAFNRSLTLLLVPDTATFDKEASEIFDSVKNNLDTSHLYHGSVKGKSTHLNNVSVKGKSACLSNGSVKGYARSQVYGFIIDGLFQGKITLTPTEILYIERKEKYQPNSPLLNEPKVHSVVYREKDVIDAHQILPQLRGSCGNSLQKNIDWMNKMLQGTKHRRRIVRHQRTRRQAPNVDPKQTCEMQLMSDPELWRHFEDTVGRNEVTIRKEITGIFQYLIRELNNFLATSFVTPDGTESFNEFNVKVVRVLINSSASCARERYGLCTVGVDASNTLNLFSDIPGLGDFCHSHLLTYRNYDDATVGLAWVGAPGLSTGVCSKPSSNGLSHNTGFTTMLSFGKTLPVTTVRFVFAHEFGHNLGSPHDPGDSTECSPASSGSANKGQGNFIMYPHTSSGILPNNFKWSPCTKRSIATIISDRKKVRPDCLKGKFVVASERQSAFCGNNVKEDGEECDCGFTQDCTDCCKCCFGRGVQSSNMCTLKPNMACDPSQGPCCTTNCEYAAANRICSEETECTGSAVCTGTNSTCPAGTPINEKKLCNENTQICKSGECTGTACELIQDNRPWQRCSATKETLKGAECYLSCQKNGSTDCWSSSSILDKNFPIPFKDLLTTKAAGKAIPLPAGSECDNYNGFCDAFLKCQLLNDKGPLARLAGLIFSKTTFDFVLTHVKEYWYIAALSVLALILLMISIVSVLSVTTPSNNPAIQLKYKIKRRSQQLTALKKLKVKGVKAKLEKDERRLIQAEEARQAEKQLLQQKEEELARERQMAIEAERAKDEAIAKELRLKKQEEFARRAEIAREIERIREAEKAQQQKSKLSDEEKVSALRIKEILGSLLADRLSSNILASTSPLNLPNQDGGIPTLKINSASTHLTPAADSMKRSALDISQNPKVISGNQAADSMKRSALDISQTKVISGNQAEEDNSIYFGSPVPTVMEVKAPRKRRKSRKRKYTKGLKSRDVGNYNAKDVPQITTDLTEPVIDQEQHETQQASHAEKSVQGLASVSREATVKLFGEDSKNSTRASDLIGNKDLIL
ncbi:disintegrin and metalloproteinase domain-containing protein 10-like [Watersipora subatra]|uniref:disintegrin and metalloproteinase domain-containing protein 10-like n=1 Tax=Watersipora subatra TaxID=2589382 RepID=UPI00355BEE9B